MEAFIKNIREIIGSKNVLTSAMHRLAWGTDAGFYRLVPQVVLFPENEQHVSAILHRASMEQIPLTFRAAGTSLSGQAISDSVLVVAGKKWERYSISADSETITLEPGIIGARVNEILAPLGKKFAPDPASLKAAMVGGIVMNNASGMNCGTHANSDKMLVSARIIFADGSILDTGDSGSRHDFATRHPDIIKAIEILRDKVNSNTELRELIRYKYYIKNVTGLNILPLIEHHDPFDIITHLMVGSEGTLAFLSQATFRTQDIPPHRASAMVYFGTTREACQAILRLKPLSVIGAELLDRKALRSVDSKKGMPDFLKDLPSDATAVLVETKGSSLEELHENIAIITEALKEFQVIMPVEFLDKAQDYDKLWAIRSGIFPSVGAMRKAGTTCLIEDVAFHLEHLPEATAQLQEIIARHGYHDGAIYGHALEGNYHFIINQSFDTQSEIERYEQLMDDVINLVVDKYHGSLKAEHGTGRNMAPFVSCEWGAEAFEIMRQIKDIFDPLKILNPGVIFNNDPRCHIQNLKSMNAVNPHVDKCIECGFCEVNCLTSGLTLSSRQRIVVQREIARLESLGLDARDLKKWYRYSGEQTCAGDGLCARSCPMEINTAHLTHDIRHQQTPQGGAAWRVGNFAADHFAQIKSGLRPVLWIANVAHSTIGTRAMSALCGGLHKGLGIPLWTAAMPKPFKIKDLESICASRKVVYFPSCINQTMGTAKGSPYPTALATTMTNLLEKAGYHVIYPRDMENLCCGTIWESKGMPDIADRKTRELEAALIEASENGLYPILCDQSPCLYRMRKSMPGLKLYEPAEFIETYMIEHLTFNPTNKPIALHITCSMTKMELRQTIIRLANRCSTQVIVPQEVGCCGFAGDKGFTHPEVNAFALRKLRPQLTGIEVGYSNSRTCEIGLTTNSGIPYVSIVHLVDMVTN